MAAITSLSFLVESHIRNLDNQVSAFEDAIREMGERWADLVANLVIDLDRAPDYLALRQIHYLSGQLQGQLNGLGYTALAQKFISGYSDSEVYSRQVLEAIGKIDLIESPLPPDALRQLRDFDYSAFQEIGANAVRALAKELTYNTLLGTKRSVMIKQMENVLDSQFKAKAASYADTALRKYDRAVTMSVWEEGGLDKFEYFGPKDKRNSPFCAARVGKIFSKAEVDAMKNPAGLPVKLYGGHFGCRHTFVPVIDRADDQTQTPEDQ